MKQYAVGIDLGGTNIKGGLVRRDGSVVVRTSIKTEAHGGPDHVIRRIAGLVAQVIADGRVEKADIAGVCVGSPGPLDSNTGIIYEAPNLYWRDVHLSAMLEPLVGLPVRVENDANAAAVGEAWVGAGRGLDCVILLTLGTGIGGGIVIGGKLWRGVSCTAGELGHITINYEGPGCNCGNRGCIETYAGAPGVIRRLRRAVESGRDSSLKQALAAGEEVDPEMVHRAALAGDALSKEIIEETGRLLGIAAASLVNIFNPNCIVLHGGMVNAGEMLLGPLVAEMRSRCFAAAHRVLRVLPSALRGDAGIVGAAGCAFDAFR